MLPNIDEIKRRRMLLQVTQKNLAMMCRISQSLVAKIERKRVSPSYNVVKNIFEMLENLESKNDIKASEIMNRPLIFVRPDEKIQTAVKIMKERGFSQLPIIKGGVSVGSISEKNILDLISSGLNPKSLYNKKCVEFMDNPFPSVNKETMIGTIAAILKQNFAVLVNDKGKHIGIITKTDLLTIGKR